jgi:mannitol/fructose-specific phosphotransferase system IIA component (Ntr-type)
MRLTELFGREDLVVGFKPADKWQAIRDLVDHLVARGRLGAEGSEEVLEAVLSREKSMSTGMERGIAIPHAAVDDLESVVACMGLVSAEGGLPFESIDGQPARVVVLLVIPRAQKLLHIRTLADIARTLSREDVRTGLLEAKDADAAYALLHEQDS